METRARIILTRHAHWFVLVLSAAAILWIIPRLGPHHDENFFLKPVFFPQWSSSFIAVAGHKIPLMLISYTGAPKAWLYHAIFGFVPPNLWSLRLPMLAFAVWAILLVRSGFQRLGLPLAGNLMTIVLAGSPLVMLTSVFDWGPVCLQFLFLALCFHCWSRALAQTSGRWLTFSLFFAGLGVWEKMTFAICFGPIVALMFVEALRCLPREKRVPAALLAILAFVAGAGPMLYATFSATLQPVKALLTWEGSAPVYAHKLRMLGRAIVGSSLVGYLTSPDFYWPRIGNPVLKEFSRALAVLFSTAYEARSLVAGIILAGLGVPGPTRRFRSLLLAGLLLSWLTMASFRNLGGAAQHTVLLLPVLFVILSLSVDDAWRLGRPWRIAAAALAATIVFLNTASFLDYLLRFQYLPVPRVWSPAILTAARYVVKHPPQSIYADDWGLENAVVLLSAGKIVPYAAAPDRASGARNMADPAARFIGFAPGKQSFPDGPKVLGELAAELRLKRCVDISFTDSTGEPLVEIYRYAPIGVACPIL